MMFYFRFNIEVVNYETLMKFYLFLPAILMISNLPTYSLKGIKIEKKLIPFLITLLQALSIYYLLTYGLR